jgi:hypothetical protein
MDLLQLQLTAARAVQVMQQQVQQVHDGCVALGWHLPAKPSRPLLLQCTPDLLCADWEALQKLLEALAVAPQAALETTAGSMAAAVAAAMGVVQAVARGDVPRATAGAEQATNAAAAAIAAADGVQQLFLLAGQQQRGQEQQDTQEQQEMQQESGSPASPGLAELPDVQPAPAPAVTGGSDSDGPGPTQHWQSPEQQQQGTQHAPEGSRVGSSVLGPASEQQQGGSPSLAQ